MKYVAMIPKTANIAVTNSGTYLVVVSNAVGKVTSANALVTVIAPPAITTYPKGQSLISGQDLVLSVVATGTKPLYTNLLYQWTFNATNALADFSASTGRVLDVIPFTSSRATAETKMEGNIMVHRGAFQGVWNEAGKNLAPNGATEVCIDTTTGKIVSVK